MTGMLSEHRARRRATGVTLITFLMAALLVGLVAGPAGATVFSNPTPISIPSSGAVGTGTPYPSGIAVSGLAGTIVDVNVTLSNLSHMSFADDVDVLVVGPLGQKVTLMADAGGGFALIGVNLTFDDAAAGGLPDSTLISSGTYDPTSFAPGFEGPAPAPSGPYGTSLSVFNTTAPNGTWNLFVFDDFSVAEGGSMAGGWSLDITTNAPTITSFSPTSGGAGTSVSIVGTNFTGAMSVTFNNVAATSFTVNSPTSITATVPATATTGPIRVTTPNGTAISATNFTFIPAPTITSFAPGSGEVGDSVVITGTTFTGATAVAFNGTAATFTVNSPTQITTTVPAGASSGPLSVTTPAGTGTSTTSFIVKHARTVSLSVGNKASGFVNVDDGFDDCASGVLVKVQHFENGRFRTVGSDSTNNNGKYSVPGTSDPGRYRAIAKATTVGSGDKCLKATSSTIHS